MSLPSSPEIDEKIFEGVIEYSEEVTETAEECFEDDDEDSLPLLMGYLTPKLKEQAKNELFETEETIEKSLKAIRELISSKPSFNCRVDDDFLIQFLRARKYNVERSFKLLQNYCKFRKEHAAKYDYSNMKAVFDIFRKNYFGVLKKRDKNGCVVCYLRFGEWDPDEDSFDNLFRATIAGLCFAIADPATQITGYRIILDTRGITWKQMKYGTPQNGILALKSTQFCFPARCKGIHLLTTKTFFKVAFQVVYPFLTSKLKRRVHMHGEDPRGLREYISPSVLPEEFGGLAGPIDNSDWVAPMDYAKDTALVIGALEFTNE